MSESLTIGKVAKLGGVNIQTVHYYERRGILFPDDRRDSGYRLYNEEAVQKLRFIKNAQALGFTLKEIEGLLKLRVSHRARCGDVKRKAETKLRSVREKIASLKAMEKTLLGLVRTCRIKATTDRCPILRSLEIKDGKRSLPKGGSSR
ncbi:MAG: heavy metal-responsive transcriptional regulator [Elusimicrobia bacterium]|nr:heavy metal-responsive transcriptional regulator [Elusimicrobiota bacterium]